MLIDYEVIINWSSIINLFILIIPLWHCSDFPCMDGEIWVGEIYLIADSDSVMKFRPQILQHIVFKLAVNNLINVYNWVNVNKNLASLHYRGYFLISQLLIEFDLPDPKAYSLDIHGCLDFHITYSLHDCFHQEKINCFLNRIAEVHFTFSTHLQTLTDRYHE